MQDTNDSNMLIPFIRNTSIAKVILKYDVLEQISNLETGTGCDMT